MKRDEKLAPESLMVVFKSNNGVLNWNHHYVYYLYQHTPSYWLCPMVPIRWMFIT